MQKAFVQGIKKEYVEDKLVDEILEIRNMISMLEDRANSEGHGQNTGKFETLLQTLRYEMIKRVLLLASRYDLNIKPLLTSLNNGGDMFKEPFYDAFSKIEEELNRAYRVARDVLDNLSRMV
ncbi:MAG: hypothetical protein QXJ72_00320 [Thermoproteota archaeon]